MSGRPALTVTQLTSYVRGALAREPELEDVLVEGEVSNLRIPASGHVYLTLKDRQASLRCVCFRSSAQRIRFNPENGMTVIAHGRIDVYEQDGSYQLYVDRLEPAGIGALALAVQQVLDRLRREGLFDESRKRTLAILPRRIAVVTSMSGAALRDVLTVAGRRAPQVGVVVVPAAVQGEEAVPSLIAGLRRAQRLRRVDTILMVRGGGSLEDLWAFQSEALARVIRQSRVPVVTGVGHETDTTVADHAADRRAPTPSAAAEVAVPDADRLADELSGRTRRLRRAFAQELGMKRAALAGWRAELERLSPERRVASQRQSLDRLSARLRSGLVGEVGGRRRALGSLDARLRLASPERRVPTERQRIEGRRRTLDGAGRALLAGRRAELVRRQAQLQALSPRRTLERGYSVTLDGASGAVVTSARALHPGQLLRTLLAEGEAESRVEPAQGAAARDG